jgi:type I restriction enzyme, S subunit
VNVAKYAKSLYTPELPVKRLKFALQNTQKSINFEPEERITFCKMEAIGEQGEFDTSETRAYEDVSSGYTRFFEGDVLVAKITPCFENGKGAIALGLEKGIGFGTTELYVLTPGLNLDARYLYYITVSDTFRGLGEASMTGAAGQKRVPDDFISDFPIWLPPLETQRRIADYLDAETAQIDALIAEKERMLELLEEKRAALVSRAVTKGLNPDVPMKDSGLEWLGKIPAHWDFGRAKRFLSLREEVSEAGEEELLTVSHITGVTLRSAKDVNMFKAEDMTGYKRCYPGDLVVNTLWAWMGAMGVAQHEGIVSPAYHVYIPRDDLRPAYVDVLCRSKPFVAEVIRFSKGVWSSRLRLYPESLLDIQIPVPPLEEQDEIIYAVAFEVQKSSEFKRTLDRSIELLKERRSALITAAVTGQLELEGVPA